MTMIHAPGSLLNSALEGLLCGLGYGRLNRSLILNHVAEVIARHAPAPPAGALLLVTVSGRIPLELGWILKSFSTGSIAP
jgi:hypothetical protein